MIRRLSFLTILLSAFVLLGSTVSVAEVPSADSELKGDYVYVHLQNSCTHDVRYEIKTAGQASSGTISKKEKKRMTLKAGAKIYIDGELFMEVEDSDDGETYVVCR